MKVLPMTVTSLGSIRLILLVQRFFYISSITHRVCKRNCCFLRKIKDWWSMEVNDYVPWNAVFSNAWGFRCVRLFQEWIDGQLWDIFLSSYLTENEVESTLSIEPLYYHYCHGKSSNRQLLWKLISWNWMRSHMHFRYDLINVVVTGSLCRHLILDSYLEWNQIVHDII